MGMCLACMSFRGPAVGLKHPCQTGNNCDAGNGILCQQAVLPRPLYSNLNAHSPVAARCMYNVGMPSLCLPIICSSDLVSVPCRMLPDPQSCCCCYSRLCSGRLKSPLLPAKHCCSPNASRSRRSPGLLLLQPLYAIRCTRASDKPA